ALCRPRGGIRSPCLDPALVRALSPHSSRLTGVSRCLCELNGAFSNQAPTQRDKQSARYVSALSDAVARGGVVAVGDPATGGTSGMNLASPGGSHVLTRAKNERYGR